MSKGTDRRTVRVAQDLWDEAGRVAASNGETISEVIRRALVKYARQGVEGSLERVLAVS